MVHGPLLIDITDYTFGTTTYGYEGSLRVTPG